MKWLCVFFATLSLINVSPTFADVFVTESGIGIEPKLKVKTGRNDNLLRASDSENKVSTGFVIIDPGVSFRFLPGENEFILSYKLSHGRYFSSTQDNFTDHFLDSQNLFRVGLRHAFRFDLKIASLHEARGTGITEGESLIIDRPLEYQSRSVVSTYLFGAPGAKGRIETKLGYIDREYSNFRDLEGSASGRSSRFNDYIDRLAGVKFVYQWFRNTSAFIEYELANKNYLFTADGVPSQDSITNSYFVGLEWELTGKSSGYAKVGFQDRNFEDDERENFEGLSWLVGFDWRPRYRSTLNLETSQVARDPDQDGDFIEETVAKLGWKHYWRPQIFTTATASLKYLEYTGSFQNGVLRDEDVIEWFANIGYEFYQKSDVYLGIRKTEKSSTFEGFDYDRLVWTLSLNIEY